MQKKRNTMKNENGRKKAGAAAEATAAYKR